MKCIVQFDRKRDRYCIMASSSQSFLEQHFLLSNKFVLLVMGLRSNQNQNNQLLIISIIIVYGFPVIVHQFYQLLTSDFEFQLAIKVLQKISIVIFMINGYSNTYFSFLTMKLLFNGFNHDCKQLSNDEELRIMKKYIRENKLYSYCLTILFSLYFLSIIFPSILNVILYLFGMLDDNKLTLLLPVNNIANGGTYFYILLVYQIIGGFIVAITGSFYYLTYLVFVQHACYQFKIITSKIQQFPQKKQQYIGISRNRKIPWEEYDWIVDIIKRYRKVLEYVDLINNYSKIVYLISIFFAMIFVIFDYLYLFRISEILQNPKDAIECGLIFFASILLLYLNFYVGQKLLNHSSATYEELRQIPFYMLSLESQKLLLLTITRSMRPSGLSIGGMFVSSNEVFVSIIRKAFSFATVYYSSHKT